MIFQALMVFYKLLEWNLIVWKMCCMCPTFPWQCDMDVWVRLGLGTVPVHLYITLCSADLQPGWWISVAGKQIGTNTRLCMPNPEDGSFPGEGRQKVNTLKNPFFLGLNCESGWAVLVGVKWETLNGEREPHGSRYSMYKASAPQNTIYV